MQFLFEKIFDSYYIYDIGAILVPGGKLNKYQVESINEMIDSFLERWESTWYNSDNFTKEERKLIKAHLSVTVLGNYTLTSSLSFGEDDLQKAIESCAEAEYSDDYSVERFRQVEGLDLQCMQFIKFFLKNWEKKEEFNHSEIELITGRLYSEVLQSYESSNFTCLEITYSNINNALDVASKFRHRRSVQAARDTADREIAEKRDQIGTVGYPGKNLFY